MRSFLFTVGFLTRVPVPRDAQMVDDGVIRRALLYFPLVGVLVGLCTAAVIFGLSHIWPAWLAVLIALAVEARLTGAMHEDAIADLADAFGGGWDREAVLRILKDSRVGAYGSLALIFGIALRAGAMIELEAAELYLAVPLAAGVGRLSMLGVLWRLRPAPGRESLTGSFGEGLTLGRVLLASTPVLALAVLGASCAPQRLLLAIALLVLLHLWATRSFERRIGGVSGDALGSVAFLGQLIVLLAAAARLS